jgi:hypothetical protein
MEKTTDILSNWILEENLTEVSVNRNNLQILNDFTNDISIKAEEINIDCSISKNEIKNLIDQNILSLYFPQVINAKKVSASLNHTQNTQRWIGYVIEKSEKIFKARLEDITNPGTFEIGTFDIKDAFDEKEMIQLGAVFYLSVGYDVSRGTYAKQKLIRFQRLAEWNVTDFDTAIDRATRIASNLNWE